MQKENTLLIPESISKDLPAMVKNELSKLSHQKQEEFIDEFKRRRKDIVVAYLLGAIGFHYLYLGRIGLFFAFAFTGGGFLIWYFVDLFRTLGMVKDYNRDVAMEIMRNLKVISS